MARRRRGNRQQAPQQQHLVQQNMPPWLEAIYRGMAERAQAIRQEPYAPFPGVPHFPARLAQFPRDYRMLHFPRDIRRAHELGREEDIELPYFLRAEQFGERAGRTFPQQYRQYMNPYEDAVVNRIREDALRNFNEGTLPALRAQFGMLGQPGSRRHMEAAVRSARDVEREMVDRMREARAEGYGQAAQIHGQDRARLADLMGRFGGLGVFRRQGRQADIGQLQEQGERQLARGQQAMDVGYQDFLRQQGYPYEQLQRQAAIMHGVPYNQQMYEAYQQPQYRENFMGRMGNIMGNIYGMNMLMGRKKGGSVHPPKMKKMHKMSKLGKMAKMKKMPKLGKKPGPMSFMQTSMIRHPKVGGSHGLSRSV